MKNLFFIFAVVLLSLTFSVPVNGQKKSYLLTFDEVQKQMQEVSSLPVRYELAQKEKRDKFILIRESRLEPDSELFKQAYTDLVRSYFRSKQLRSSYSDLWGTIGLYFHKEESLLLGHGWTQSQVDSSRPLLPKLYGIWIKLNKIDDKFGINEPIEQFLISYDSSLVTIM